MFALAFLIGIYSYIIFSLGILGALTRGPVLVSSLIFIAGAYLYFKKHKEDLPKLNLKNKKIRPFLALFGVLTLVNLVGALAPELSFDALWYHLTIPKIFIEEGRLFYINGGLFYYSVMPKLGEMLFIPGLLTGSEIIPKLIQWGFGILTSICVYKISRKYFDEKISMLSVLVFYGSLVVAWQSTVAYVDLIRSFFEVMALWGFLEFLKTRKTSMLIESSVLVGLAVCVKLIALGSIPIFGLLIFYLEKDRKLALKNSLLFGSVALLVALPWFFYAFITTGNPIYPIFSGYPLEGSFLNPINDLINLFLRSADPISPIYLIFLPLIVIYFKKMRKELKIVTVYSLIALIIWLITPKTGGGRFILPYLPAFSILAGAVIHYTNDKNLKKYLIGIVLFVFVVTIGYRAVANVRYLPVVLGQESKSEFLTKNLNFNFGDFYDTNGWFAENIKPTDKVLLFGFHNLYYVDFPFIHESYVKKGDKFNYIATQNAELPGRFSYWKLVHRNNLTNVSVYTNNKELWYY